MNWQQRESGILLHPSSLPGPYGIGEIGPEAERFVERLAAMGQRLWQVLPLGPTSYGDSPYQSLSTFAGNDLLISFERLLEDGLVSRRTLNALPDFSPERVDFGEVIPLRQAVLTTVCKGFARRAGTEQKAAFAAFCEAEADWLDDYALYLAIKNEQGGNPWTQWPPGLRDRETTALKTAGRTLRTAIRHAKIRQFLFFDQWRRLREFCHRKGVRIIGDIPIFVAHDSSDVWAHRDLFYLAEDGMPTVVAGVPPDYFSAIGQRWGNPLYRWDRHAETGYAWWIARMKKVFEVVDVVRIDHFRGFEAYWEIDANEPTAVKGEWIQGPNHDLFTVMIEALGTMPIIAEDLGVITPEVEALRDDFEFPGMRILQFAFGTDPKAAEYQPHGFPPRCVCYTGTHDNDTTVGWFWSDAGEGSTRTQAEIEEERRQILSYVHTDGSQIHWDLMSVASRSGADTVIFPLQDLLGLDSSARMNVPGEQGGNWQWRFQWDHWSSDNDQRLLELTRFTERI